MLRRGVSALVLALVWITATLAIAADEIAIEPSTSAQALFSASRITQLSDIERAWLAKLGAVKLALVRNDWPPFDIIGSSNRYLGLSADYALLKGARLGIKIHPVVFATWNDALDGVRSGRADMLVSVARTPERESFLTFTRPYAESTRVVITREDNRSIISLADVRDKRLAVERGFPIQEELKRFAPNAEAIVVDSTLEALNRVARGDADAYIGSGIPALYLIEYELITNLVVRAPAGMATSSLGFALRLELAPLAALFDRTLIAMTEQERSAISHRWITLSAIARLNANNNLLSDSEREWTIQHPILRIGQIANRHPLSFVDPQGNFVGLTSDYATVVAERADVQIENVTAANETELLELLTSGRIDIAAALARTPQRAEVAAFSRAFVTLPWGLATRQGEPTPKSLSGKRVAIPVGIASTQILGSDAVNGRSHRSRKCAGPRYHYEFDYHVTDRRCGARSGHGWRNVTPRAPISLQEARQAGKLVLMLDDHPSGLALTLRQLSLLGYTAETADNGAKGLAMWRNGRYGLVLTDCQMPVMDGYQLATEIRRIEVAEGLSRIPVIACTASALLSEAEACLEAGMDDHIPKPLTLSILKGKLDRWLPLDAPTPSNQTYAKNSAT